jgi:S-adenosylmethionine:tRNA ribosyltransferase-isomerase
MKTSDFLFDLPPELVAQVPTTERGSSRLLVLDRATGSLTHSAVADIGLFIEPGTVMVFNDSRVRKARIYGTSADSGSEVEFLLVRKESPTRWLAMAKKAKRQRIGRRYGFPEGLEGLIAGEEGELRIVEFSFPVDDAWLDRNGHIPLPPYIKRDDTVSDAERYQTVYSKPVGSAAAPTAGLHFTEPLLQGLRAEGIETLFVTLHVGMGTFLPIRTDTLEEHHMHEEEFTVPEDTAERIEAAKREGRPVLAVGTTSVRTLESAWKDGGLVRGWQKTSLFIYPGYQFNVVDKMFTNFHTPGSSLLVLVSAFAGRDKIRTAYEEAIRERYRFFSYGDAMLML